LPSLAGRAPETGAFARHWRHVDLSSGALPARLHARMIDIAQNAELLVRAAADEGDNVGIRSVVLASRESLAAVETTRGALYHWVRLAADNWVKEYAIVAPTEWNFHPAGPFVAAALGAPARSDLTRRSLA
jgi:Ni,Fe-hydrogenase I large subunit